MELPLIGAAGGGGASSPLHGDRSEVAAWFCAAPDERVAADLAHCLVTLGLKVAVTSSLANHAIVVLSPVLARSDPTELAEWVRTRGTDDVVLVLAAGNATWEAEHRRFASDADAVPASVREAFTTQPMVLDLRGADEAKLERAARRLAGAISSSPAARSVEVARPTTPEGKRVSYVAIAALIVLAVLVVGVSAHMFLKSEHPASLSSTTPTIGPVATNLPTTSPSATTTFVTSAVSTTLRAGVATTSVTTSPSATTTFVTSAASTTLAVTTTRPPQTVPPATTAPPTTTLPDTSAGGAAQLFPWVLVGVLAVALVGSIGLRLKKRGATPAGRGRATTGGQAPQGAAQVFISHDTETDGAVAHSLADRLRQRHLAVWIAPDSIDPGDPWVFAIERGLTGSRAALVLVSPAALASGWVRREIQMIIDLEIDGRLHVVPVRVAPCDLPLLLSAYQWVDLSNFDGAAESLRERLVTLAPSSSSA